MGGARDGRPRASRSFLIDTGWVRAASFSISSVGDSASDVVPSAARHLMFTPRGFQQIPLLPTRHAIAATQRFNMSSV